MFLSQERMNIFQFYKRQFNFHYRNNYYAKNQSTNAKRTPSRSFQNGEPHEKNVNHRGMDCLNFTFFKHESIRYAGFTVVSIRGQDRRTLLEPFGPSNLHLAGTKFDDDFVEAVRFSKSLDTICSKRGSLPCSRGENSAFTLIVTFFFQKIENTIRYTVAKLLQILLETFHGFFPVVNFGTVANSPIFEQLFMRVAVFEKT